MRRRATLALVLAGLFVLPTLAFADVVLHDASWESVGEIVRFHLQFHNPGPSESGPVSGVLSSQPYGAFLQNHGEIGTFDVPSLAVDSFFDIWYEVSRADLPPSAEEITPGNPGSTAPGVTFGAQALCPPDNFWNGNIDVFWSGPGGSGQANYHVGTVLVCPGAGPSYIHIFGDCPTPPGLSWNFSPACAGWIPGLVVDNAGSPGGPAPNPFPPGFFDGWICVSADASVTIGSTCTIQLNMVCGTETVVVELQVEACDWSTVPVEAVTWGRIKAQYE